MSRPLGRLLACAGLALIVCAYGCDVGHGFVKDDFGWILSSRGFSRLLGAPMGFFRPAVSATFAIDHALFGVRPLGYGLTNLAILLACTGATAALLAALGIRRGVALAGAIVWALNFQGINMAVLWISGRTALLLALWSVSSAWAWSRGARFTAAALAALAMLSKEEAFALPAILTMWALIDLSAGEKDAARWPVVWRRTWPLWAVAAVCFALRMQSGAMTPATATPVYRYQFDVATLAGNTVSYLDRVATTAVLALVIFWIAAGRPSLSSTSAVRRIGLKGLVWLVLGFALTILLPVRSSLYAVMPSIGIAMIVAATLDGLIPAIPPASLKRGAILLTVIFVLLYPVYRLRNQRYVSEAELSASIVSELARIAASQPSGSLVVIRDVRSGRPTAEQAFGPGVESAAALMTGGKIRVWIDPPPSELAGTPAPDLSQAIAVLTVEEGEVRRTP
jgi:hypothetical protein